MQRLQMKIEALRIQINQANQDLISVQDIMRGKILGMTDEHNALVGQLKNAQEQVAEERKKKAEEMKEEPKKQAEEVGIVVNEDSTLNE